MIGLVIALTYVAQALGVAGLIAGLVLLARLGPPRRRTTTTTDDAGTTTYWLGADQISRREYEHLRRRP